MNTFNRCIAHVLIICIMGMTMPVSSFAGIVTTDQIYAVSGRDQVRSFLNRADVQAALQAQGVDPNAARARVDALSDDEVVALANRIDQLPAGGSDVLGVLLVVFVILLITDILGVTKVFPFTRAVR
jgi:uncharacterized protein DUF6627